GDSNRIPMALRLLRERNGPLVLLSGVEPGIPLVEIVNSQGSSTVDIHKTWERIVTESRSRTTIENAEEAAPILKEKQITRIILVTSDYHMPRAKKIFQKTIPEMELYEYPVASDFSELHFSGMRKFFAEFWKNFFYSVGILRFFS
ncbi:MAG: YdcF family protein, partial [Bdellovibrionales bacterium]|nr:YdcF family protein [Bdellovibrionales bacterium]